jgi:scyllo-inositol 2-dehydrogenase (NADP+)
MAKGVGRDVAEETKSIQSGKSSSNGRHPTPTRRSPRGSQKAVLKIALCGLGRAAMGLLNREVLAMKQVRIVGSFDLLRDRAEALSARLGSKVYDSYAQLLADPEVELVVVATRSIEHTPMAIEALKAGKHVLVEKPMGVNLRQADQLLKASKKSAGRLFVRHNRRFEPAFLQVKEIIASKKLGEIYQIALRVHKYQKRNDWQTLREFGGGQLLNWGPHVIDWGLQLLKSPVADMWSDLKRVAAAGDAEDTIKLLLRGENGVVVDIEISDAVALGQPGWFIFGSRGMLVIHGTTCKLRFLHPKLRLRVTADAATPSASGGYAGPAKLEWIEETFEVAPRKQTKYFHELYKTLKQGAEFPVSLEQARENLRIIELARRGTKFG